MTHQEAREPFLGLVLALCVPGGGHAYVQRWTDVLVLLAIYVALYLTLPWWVLAVFHVLQAFAGMGAVARWNREHSRDVSRPVPPPRRRNDG